MLWDFECSHLANGWLETIPEGWGFFSPPYLLYTRDSMHHQSKKSQCSPSHILSSATCDNNIIAL